LLKNAPEVQLQALFSPEHGIRGAVDEKVGDSVDEQTGLPVFSLYGETTKPKAEQLQDLDALVFDIQDIGCRFYTYTATMGHCMEAAAEHGKKYFVLDRVNPINGVTVDGPVLTGKTSFVGYHIVPLRYGMTIGELAEDVQSRAQPQRRPNRHPARELASRHVVRPDRITLDEPLAEHAQSHPGHAYPGIGLLESALSVGRGTDTPFELVGAPYIDDVKLADELNGAGLAGVRFVPIRFTPTYSVHKGKTCGGVFHSPDGSRPVQRCGRGFADCRNSLSPLPKGF